MSNALCGRCGTIWDGNTRDHCPNCGESSKTGVARSAPNAVCGRCRTRWNGDIKAECPNCGERKKIY